MSITAGTIVKVALKYSNAKKITGVSKILTYEKLFTNSYSKLRKLGFTDKQLISKLSKFYLKEGRQLIINEEQGKTISSALRLLKRGKVSQGNVLQKTAETNLKNDLANLRKLKKHFGDNSVASDLLRKYERGEINVYRLHNSTYSYINNLAEYESKSFVNSSIVNNVLDAYSPDIDNPITPYRHSDIVRIYNENGY